MRDAIWVAAEECDCPCDVSVCPAVYARRTAEAVRYCGDRDVSERGYAPDDGWMPSFNYDTFYLRPRGGGAGATVGGVVPYLLVSDTHVNHPRN